MPKQAKSVEEIYQKKTPIEHVLIRPDTYVGSVQPETRSMFVWCSKKQRIIRRDVNYVPGLYKILDEILVNAADNKTRDPSMSTIKVHLNRNCSEISVFNDGKGIPVAVHAKEQVYVPELIFGHLLTSSNYDDSEKKITGGRNGYGAKLCNIFSSEFTVETADQKRKLLFTQTYRRNMLERSEPEIREYTGPEYTRITFKPDLQKFSMAAFDDDFVSLVTKRVYDLAGTVPGISVYLNEEKIPISSFKEYVRLYVGESVEVVHESTGRWEVAFVPSDDQFQQVSFVNRISTARGGTHVSCVLDQIVTAVADNIKKKEKGLEVKAAHVKAYVSLFVNCLIENPSFDSQTKETLTLKPASFGSKCVLSSRFLSEVLNTGIGDRAARAVLAKQRQQLKKTDGHKTLKLRGIPKLDDANNAGTKLGINCTLILTEGDSAKALAVSGLSVIGRDNYGVFPLRGKLLNVREATHKQLLENAEINSIKKILGLQHGKDYETVESLRYGHLMIMTDQDHDGSHIKGLIINMLEHFFPSLLRISGFLLEFITPIVRATKGKLTRDFFTVSEFEAWTETQEGIEKGWKVKYYKGLGTSTAQDAKTYFSNLALHVKEFTPLSGQDAERIELAFSKKRVDARKGWLRDFVPGTYLDNRVARVSITDFIDRELIHFSMADNTRSIPSVIDGLKPGQRKVLFCCFKRNLKSEIKVAQLAGYVAEHSAYHHGEQSLCMTIVNLAQDHVGSNNIPLLQPIGQFGTRLQGGKDAASPRYIYTALDPITRLLFREEDDALLTYLKDDNMLVEPGNYVPVVPVLLINGAEGIGTGWSTNIPSYNPREVAENLKRRIRGERLLDMKPWFRGFRGAVCESEKARFKTVGVFEVHSKDTFSITELPIGVWTQAYKEFLDTQIENGVVKDFREYNTDRHVLFRVQMQKSIPRNVEKTFKLASYQSTGNMVAFNSEGHIHRYASPTEILEEFFRVRHDLYVRRKEFMLAKLARELQVLEARVMFVGEIVAGRLSVLKRKSADVCADLEAKNYYKKDNSYDYLLGMHISALTQEKICKLEAEAAEKQEMHRTLQEKTVEEIWISDIDSFLQNLSEEKNEVPVHPGVPKYMKTKRKGEEFASASTGRKTRAPSKATAKKPPKQVQKVTAAKKPPAPQPQVVENKSPKQIRAAEEDSESSIELLSNAESPCSESSIPEKIPIPTDTRNAQKIPSDPNGRDGKNSDRAVADGGSTEEDKKPWERYLKLTSDIDE